MKDGWLVRRGIITGVLSLESIPSVVKWTDCLIILRVIEDISSCLIAIMPLFAFLKKHLNCHQQW